MNMRYKRLKLLPNKGASTKTNALLWKLHMLHKDCNRTVHAVCLALRDTLPQERGTGGLALDAYSSLDTTYISNLCTSANRRQLDPPGRGTHIAHALLCRHMAKSTHNLSTSSGASLSTHSVSLKWHGHHKRSRHVHSRRNAHTLDPFDPPAASCAHTHTRTHEH